MSTGKTLEITLEGLDRDAGNVDLLAFAQMLNKIRETLSALDLELNRTKTMRYRIVDLTHSSPSRIVVEEVPNENLRLTNNHKGVVTSFIDCALDIKAGKKSQLSTSEILTKYQQLSAEYGKSFSNINFRLNGKSISVDEQFRDRITVILGAEIRSIGSLKGALEMIDIHAGRNIFNIYPITGPNKVRCRFDAKMLEKAISCLTKQVIVYGILLYRKDDFHPFEMEVTDIKALESDSELPTLKSLYGIFKDTPSSVENSGDLVRKLRNDWDKT